jgi:uncharacterized membrane protein (DUF4010 family)
LFAGGILIASGMMYVRLAGLLAIFNRDLMITLTPAFLALGALAIIMGWFWSRRGAATGAAEIKEPEPPNPLELSAAFLFALLFLAILVVTQLAIAYLGNSGVYALAAIMGVTDVDPFIMGMTQAAGASTAVHVAASAILIAAASNNTVKGIYAWSFARGVAGRHSLLLLLALAVLGLMPLWL